MLEPSARLHCVQTPVIPIVAEWIRAHPGTISLGQGVVYYGPPARTEQMIAKCLADPDNHKYRPVDGIAPLKDLLATKWHDEHGVDVAPARRVVVTAGGNMAFMNAVLAVADPGDEIILQAPYYFNHEMAVRIAGCQPVLVPTDSAYQLQPDAIRAALTPRTRAVVTISPNNPTGAVYPEDALRAVNALCADAGVFHIHDEAYEYFTYGGVPHYSPASIPGGEAHTICLHSLSKSYGFASWRIGSMLVPASLYDAVQKIQDTILICPPVISQYAAVGALEAGRAYCDSHRPAIQRVRETFLDRTAELRDVCNIHPADGAFYFFMTVRTDLSAMTLAERLVREHGVAVVPGTTFGVEDRCAIRVSCGALKPETAARGIDRLVQGLKAVVRR